VTLNDPVFTLSSLLISHGSPFYYKMGKPKNGDITSLGFGIFESVTISYIDEIGKDLSENNAKEIDVIWSGLTNYETIKVMKCTSAKYIFNKLQNIYEERSSDFSSYESEREEAQFV
jgi:hypothetical protein